MDNHWRIPIIMFLFIFLFFGFDILICFQLTRLRNSKPCVRRRNLEYESGNGRTWEKIKVGVMVDYFAS